MILPIAKFARFLSTPSARRATGVHFYKDDYQFISIHALREEGDKAARETIVANAIFLSTPSARRATMAFWMFSPAVFAFLSTPSARRATAAFYIPVVQVMISIHALREEGDQAMPDQLAQLRQFLSTPSARRATTSCPVISAKSRFLSTPSARRATYYVQQREDTHNDFYPRPPRGGRPGRRRPGNRYDPISIHALREEGDAGMSPDEIIATVFLSTPSARRATGGGSKKITRRKISIHALREEGDTRCSPQLRRRRNFYPRPPRGGRPTRPRRRDSTCTFLSTPSARRATQGQRSGHCGHQISIHALREEGDASGKPLPDAQQDFYPRPPRGGRRPDPAARGAGLTISIHALREEGDNPSRSCKPPTTNFYPRPPRGGRLGQRGCRSCFP